MSAVPVRRKRANRADHFRRGIGRDQGRREKQANAQRTRVGHAIPGSCSPCVCPRRSSDTASDADGHRRRRESLRTVPELAEESEATIAKNRAWNREVPGPDAILRAFVSISSDRVPRGRCPGMGKSVAVVWVYKSANLLRIVG